MLCKGGLSSQGINMDNVKRTFWKSPFEAIICLVLLLLAIGCINVFSASQVAAEDIFSNSRHYLYRYGIYALMGIFAMFVFSKINYRIWLHNAERLAGLTVAMLAFVLVFSEPVNGARRWIQIGSVFSFQPSEFAKMIMIFLCAAAFGRHVDTGHKCTLKSAPLLWSLVIGFLVYKEPDMGTAAIIVGLTLGIYFICRLPALQNLLLFSLAPLGALFLAKGAAYRAERIEAWLNPWQYANEAGYQTIQSIMAIGSGGFFGTGFGQGNSKFYYLPEAHTDFSFAVLCQEWGFVGAIFVITIFAFLCYILWKSADLAPDGASYIIIMGTNFLLTGQAVANIAMVMGLLPVIGVPLPFISYGGTSLLINMAMLGTVLNIVKNGQKRMASPALQYTTQTPQRRLRLVKG